ncbi:MAG: SufD family Fe-S cluster assembly protein, partial [Eggerthellales bacterium]|nr:SufD family Fe-S cluster assembly protein [Eggerthellales bacterium]
MSTLTNAAAPAAPLSAVNPLLTPTWNRHGLNGTPVELEDLVIANETSITASSLEGFEPLTAADFDAAWNAAEDQARSMTARRVTVASTADVDETPFREFAAKAKDPLDVPARNAVPRSATDAALSDDTVAWLQENTLACASLEVPAYRTVSEPLVLRLAAQDGALSVATVNLLAGEGSTCTIIIEADSPTAGSGAVGVNLKVVAQENARVTIRQQQTLDSSWTYFESTEIKQAASSRVDVSQMYLGSAQTFAGLGSALLGARASVSINTTYLGTGDRVLDLNYLIRQFGKNTESKLIANGVLAGTSSTALWGTIDLIHGAKGAHGHELETVLLANPKVRNRSLPIILCDEDDVQGDHGATIGHVPADQRYYLGSRGLDEKTAEGLFLRSTFEKGLVNAFDQASRNAVMRLAVAELGADFAADEEEDPMTETSEDRAGTAFDPAAADIEQNPFKAD